MKYLFITIFLIACAPKKNDEVATKTVTSSWASAQGAPNWQVSLASTSALWSYGTGGSCHSDVSLIDYGSGTGEMIVSNTVDVTNVPGMANCSQFDGTWTYFLLENQRLSLCQSGKPCVIFE